MFTVLIKQIVKIDRSIKKKFFVLLQKNPKKKNVSLNQNRYVK